MRREGSDTWAPAVRAMAVAARKQAVSPARSTWAESYWLYHWVRLRAGRSAAGATCSVSLRFVGVAPPVLRGRWRRRRGLRGRVRAPGVVGRCSVRASAGPRAGGGGMLLGGVEGRRLRAGGGGTLLGVGAAAVVAVAARAERPDELALAAVLSRGRRVSLWPKPAARSCPASLR